MDKPKTHKRCNKCMRGIPFEGFHRNKGTKDGLAYSCKECALDHEALFRDKEKHRASRRTWQASNPSYTTDRRKTDIQFRLSLNLRMRMRNVLKGRLKAGSAVRDLGCTVAELKLELESQFVPGMDWSNYGNRVGQWNIDHIMPLSRFDLTNRQHVVLACHHSNLQPMWHLDNISKGNRTV